MFMTKKIHILKINNAFYKSVTFIKRQFYYICCREWFDNKLANKDILIKGGFVDMITAADANADAGRNLTFSILVSFVEGAALRALGEFFSDLIEVNKLAIFTNIEFRLDEHDFFSASGIVVKSPKS